MSEWLAVEAIVRQRDKEIMAANLAKLSQESQEGGHIPLVRKVQRLPAPSVCLFLRDFSKFLSRDHFNWNKSDQTNIFVFTG